MAIRSAVSTFIPMLEHQAKNFAEDGVHSGLLEENNALYEAVETRLSEYRRLTAQRATATVTSTNKQYFKL